MSRKPAIMILQTVLIISFSMTGGSSGQLTQWFGQLGQTAGQLVGQATEHFAKAAGDFARFVDKSEQSQRNFTASEVARCTGENGSCLYIIFDGKVLDLTDFIPYHAGGSDVLLQHAGGDASAAMRAAGMPPHVFDAFLRRFVIGILVPEAAAPTSTPAPPRAAPTCGWFAQSMGLCEYLVRIEKIYTDCSGLLRRVLVYTSATYDQLLGTHRDRNNTTTTPPYE